MIKFTNKLPNWFKWILLGLTLALIGCIVYIRNSAVDIRIEKKKNTIETIEKKKDSFVQKRNDKLDALVANSTKNKSKSKELIQKLPYEKHIVNFPAYDSIDRYITGYKYTDK